ncbi:MAG TPA: ATP-binding protein [Planctomycetota bacterium]|nr:ATP-binding protein [Planctomycetota bacterium]
MQGYANTSYEKLWHLSDLGFLRLAGPIAQDAARHHFPVYFHDSVVAAVQRSRALAHECGVSFVATLAQASNSDAAVEVLGDAVLLEAMIENVVCNALRSSPRGSRVELDVRVVGDSIALYVRDHGIGVAADRLDSLFGWFEVSSESREPSRHGLDLAIARRVAEHHRGTISFRNRTGSGCEFEIKLPRWRAEGPASLRSLKATRAG